MESCAGPICGGCFGKVLSGIGGGLAEPIGLAEGFLRVGLGSDRRRGPCSGHPRLPTVCAMLSLSGKMIQAGSATLGDERRAELEVVAACL